MQNKVRHVGIIPDGNRRWAVANGIENLVAFNLTMKNLCRVIDYLFEEHQVEIISVYGLSKENLSRGDKDLLPILSAEEYLVSELIYPLAKKWNCQVIHAGLKGLLPKSFDQKLLVLEEATKEFKDRKLNLCIAYNPIDEIKSALGYIHSVEDLKKALWVKDDVDLLIRTADGQILSNFLLLQSGYATLFFIKKYFNDVLNSDIDDAFHYYLANPRRFGK